MKKTILLSVLFFMPYLAIADTPEVKKVDWYKQHETERKAVIEECDQNPGELRNNPNCINAKAARESLTWSSRGGIIAPQPLTFQTKK